MLRFCYCRQSQIAFSHIVMVLNCFQIYSPTKFVIMKKLIANLLLLCILSTTISSFANPPITEQVLKQFAASFPAIENAQWFEGDNYFDVYFEKNKARYNIRYDRNGKVVSTRNYYSSANLAPFLRAKLAEKFPGKSIFGVTEITNSNEMYYVVVLEDKDTWTNVYSDAVGQFKVLDKLKKAK